MDQHKTVSSVLKQHTHLKNSDSMDGYDENRLKAALLPGLPESCYYISSFITEAEEERILADIQKTPGTRWINLSHRRLLSLPSTLTGTSRDTLLAAPLPESLNVPILPRFQVLGVFFQSPHSAPNHVLVNEYQPGQGIMPHEDGPSYSPITATVSLAGHTVLEIYQKTDTGTREAQPTWRILQEPRSLLIITDDTYRNTLHGIADVEIDDRLGPESIVNWQLLGDHGPFESGSCNRSTRISLTYRDVLKVTKVGNAVGFISKR